MASIEKSYEGLQDLILREQLTFICNRDLELFLREREPKSLEQASKLADQYKEARYVDIVSLTYKNNERSRSQSNSETGSRSRSPIRRGPNHLCIQVREVCMTFLFNLHIFTIGASN